MGHRQRHRKVPVFLRDGESAFRWARKHVDIEEDTYGLYEDRASTYSDFAHDAFRHGYVVVYRMVRVPRIGDTWQIDMSCLGKAWSKERRGAGVYGMVPEDLESTGDILLTATVSAGDIDWEYGFTSFLYYGEDQWEVSMLPDSPVLLTHVAEEELGEPVVGSTGPAGEVWKDTCGNREVSR